LCSYNERKNLASPSVTRPAFAGRRHRAAARNTPLSEGTRPFPALQSCLDGGGELDEPNPDLGVVPDRSPYLGALRPALDGTLVMLFGVGLVKWPLPLNQPLLLRLAADTAVGAVVYVLTILALHRERRLAFWGLVKNFRRSKA
jgi:hypothetical protein